MYCSSGEQQCQQLKLNLYIDADDPAKATFDGTYRQCWCRGSVWGSDTPIHGTAMRLAE